MKHKLFLLIAFSMVFMMNIFFVLQCAFKEPVEIGAILTLTGTVSNIGTEMKNALSIAADEINSSGGMRGRKIKFIIEDSRSDKDEGLKAYNRIKNKYHPLFYFANMSYVASGLSPVLEKDKVPLIALGAGATSITKNKDWIFKYFFNISEEVQPIKMLIDKFKIKKLGILYSEQDSGISIFNALSENLKTDDPEVIIKSVSYPIDCREFNEKIKMLDDMQAIYFTFFPENLKLILSELKAADYKGTLFSTNILSMPEMRSRETEGIFIAAPSFYNPNNLSANKLKDKYKKLYNKSLSHYGASAYDAMILINSLLENKEISKENLRKLLDDEFVYPGILGTINSGSGDHDLTYPLYPAQIVNGGLKYLENR